jgi:hypothetical protein
MYWEHRRAVRPLEEKRIKTSSEAEADQQRQLWFSVAGSTRKALMSKRKRMLRRATKLRFRWF